MPARRNGILREILHKVLEYKKLTLAVLFVVLEFVSFVLDQIGKKHLAVLVASFVLSVFGFVITIYSNCFIKRSDDEVDNCRLAVIEIVFSSAQLILTGVYFVMKAIGVHMDKEYASVFPLIFSIMVFLFACHTSIGEAADPSNGPAVSHDHRQMTRINVHPSNDRALITTTIR